MSSTTHSRWDAQPPVGLAWAHFPLLSIVSVRQRLGCGYPHISELFCQEIKQGKGKDTTFWHRFTTPQLFQLSNWEQAWGSHVSTNDHWWSCGHPTGLEIQLPDGGTGEHVSSPFACGGTGCSKEPWQTWAWRAASRLAESVGPNQ